MRLLIGSALILLGFIGGVIYDQALLDRTLRRGLAECQVRANILNDALDTVLTNKFRKRDFIYDAVQRQNRKEPRT